MAGESTCKVVSLCCTDPKNKQKQDENDNYNDEFISFIAVKIGVKSR